MVYGVINRALGVIIVLCLWELLPRIGLVSEAAVPPLSTVLDTLFHEASNSEFWGAIGATLTGWALGLIIAVICAILLGLVIGTSSLLSTMCEALVEFMRPIPSVALIPLVVLIWGTDIKSTLTLVIYASFWPMLLQVLHGIHEVDPVIRDTARSYGLGKIRKVFFVTFPSALPYIMTGLRLAVTVALVLEITGELVIGGRGLGELLLVSRSSGALASSYAIVVVSGILGVVVNMFSLWTERFALYWHPSQRTRRALT